MANYAILVIKGLWNISHQVINEPATPRIFVIALSHTLTILRVAQHLVHVHSKRKVSQSWLK